MGLNDNTKNIEIALNEKNRIAKQKERERQLKEQERKKKQEIKDNYKRLQEDIKSDLKEAFKQQFELQGLETTLFFYNLEYIEKFKNIMIQKYGIIKQQQFYNEKIEIITNKNDILEIIDNNYYKILKQIENAYKLNEKYKQQQLLLQQQEEAERLALEKANRPESKIEKFNRQFEILKRIFFVVLFLAFFPLAVILMCVFGTCKHSK